MAGAQDSPERAAEAEPKAKGHLSAKLDSKSTWQSYAQSFTEREPLGGCSKEGSRKDHSGDRSHKWAAAEVLTAREQGWSDQGSTLEMDRE